MKNTETEIKYLVDKLPLCLTKPLKFRQIYFDISKVNGIVHNLMPNIDLSIISTFRVRRIEFNDVKYVMTLKTKAIGYTRGEFEKEISEDIFNSLIKDNVISEIIKNRYVIDKNGFTFEFDEYLNLNADLITAEVEVEKVDSETLEQIERIMREDFNIKYTDVSDDIRYRNSNLIKYFGEKND